jgi:phosphoribosylanthranilate isomerase
MPALPPARSLQRSDIERRKRNAAARSVGWWQKVMTVTVKICGVTRPEDADAIVRARADFAGLVFHPRSPRHLPLDRAASLAERLRGRVRLVALLADPADDDIARAIAAVRPDFLQLHGSETPGRVAAIKARFGCPVIKAIAIAERSDLDGLPAYEDVSDMLLFDAKAPAGATREGGHGRAFDWQVLAGRTIRRPWLLAGGLTPHNVGRAIRTSGTQAVDVSSGVEQAPGIKDCDAIAAFVTAARRTHPATEETV